MIESVIEELTEAIKAQTAVMEKALPLLSTVPAAEAPAKAKTKKAKVKDPEPEAPAAESEEPAAEVDRPGWIAKITDAFKAKLTAAPEEGRQGLKDKFTALRGDFDITTINDLPDNKLEDFFNAMVERVV